MKRKKIEKKLINIIYEQNIFSELKLFNDLGIDSLDIVEIIIMIEEVFGVDIPDDMVNDMVTVKDIVDYIKKKEK